MRNEPIRLRYANQIVGVFLLVLLASTTGLAVALTNLSGVMKKRVDYYCQLPENEAADLSTGTDVVLLGKQVGKIAALDYVEGTDLVRIRLAIDPEFEKFITTNSVISLERKFGVGASYLKIRRAKLEGAGATSEKLAVGQEIRILPHVDPVERMAGDVDDASSSIRTIQQDLTPTLGSVKSTSDSMRSSVSDQVNPTLDSIKATSDSLREQTHLLSDDMRQLAKVTTDMVNGEVRDGLNSIKQSSEAATEASLKLAKTAEDLNTKTDVTNEEISKTLATMRETLTLMQKLTNESRQVVRLLRGEAEELPGTTSKINETVDDTQDMVQEIRSHWLLRGTRSDAPANQQINPSSIRAGGTR